MTDLLDRLSRLANHDEVPTEETVRGDLTRGRRARRHRSLRIGAVGLSLIAVAGVGVASAVNTGHPGVAGPGSSTIASPTVDPGDLRIQLVAYTQEQEPGFVIAKVPEGFVLEGATPYNLNIARADNLTGLSVFVGKLVVVLESLSATGDPEGTPVKVGEHDGWLRLNPAAGEYQILSYDDGQHRVVIQAAKSIGLSDAQLIEFAEGVTVTAEARALIS